MTVTADLIEANLECPTKCFLLSRDELGTGNAYAEWVRTKSASFCREGNRLCREASRRSCLIQFARAMATPEMRTIGGDPIHRYVMVVSVVVNYAWC